ncbi:MAG: hypothetical protein Q9191_002744 [Dirinaria sp. TL-2023a]
MLTSQGARSGRGRGRSSDLRTQRSGRGGSTSKTLGRGVSTPNGPSTKQFRPSSNHSHHANANRRTPPSSTQPPQGKTNPRTPQISTSPPRDEMRGVVGSQGARGALQKRANDTYQTLKKRREQERKQAIQDGVLADPDKPTSLANAITPVGICQDMCPRFERVERIVQLMVDGCERNITSSGTSEPCEEKMVKRFRRSAAGYDEQLPSDIRPPLVLRKTLDYLIDEVVGGSQPLAKVHKFVWDRTRGIRNDFSIQQVTKVEDLRIAIECFERIARFHILSLHQLSQPELGNEEFDHHQEREQLNNTLLSLMYYYDDSRHKLLSVNEAEFRAYCIIFEIQDQRPDLEDRIQQWPRMLLRDPRVKMALRIYEAAGNTSDDQGPLKPRVPFSVAQANPGLFWALVQSNAVSYTMACTAEIYFNLVRSTALEAIWKAYKGNRGGPSRMEDWVLEDLAVALGFDDEDQARTYVEEHGFVVSEKDNGQPYIDLGSVSGKHLSDANPRRKQLFSKNLVETKRHHRTLQAIVNGITSSEAQARGMIDPATEIESPLPADGQSLFLMEESQDKNETPLRSETPRSEPKASFSPPSSGTSLLKPADAAVTSVGGLAAGSDHASTLAKRNSFTPSRPGPTIFEIPRTGESFNTYASSFEKPDYARTALSPASSRTTSVDAKSEAQSTIAFETPKIGTSEGSPNESIPSMGLSNLRPLVQSQSNRLQFVPSTGSSSTPAPQDANAHPNSALPTLPGSVPINLEIPSTSISQSPLHSSAAAILFGDAASSQTLPDTDSSATLGLMTTTKPETSTKFPISKTRSSPFAPEHDPLLAAQKPTQPTYLFSPNSTPSPDPRNQERSSFDVSSAASGHAGSETSKMTIPTFPATKRLSSGICPGSSSRKGAIDFQARENLPNDLGPSASPPAIEKGLSSNNPAAQSAQRADFPGAFAHPDDRSLSKKFSETARPSMAPLCPDPESPLVDARKDSLNTLSKTMTLCESGLLQQFVEHTIGLVISEALARVDDEKSWRRATECRSLLLGKKYFGFWKRKAWSCGLLRKARERRKNFASWMGELSQGPQNRSSEHDSLGQGLGHGTLNQKSALQTQSQPLDRRKSLPVEALREPQIKTGSSAESQRRIWSSNAMRKPLRYSKVHYKASRSVRNKPLSAVSASSAGKMDTTCTDYFRLKAVGLDPDTPVVPLTSKKRPRGEDSPKSEKRFKSALNRLREGLPVDPPSEESNRDGKISVLQPHRPSTHSGEDGDESLFVRSRKLREIMAESISWLRSERARSERSSKGIIRPLTDGISVPTNSEDSWPALSRTEQRLRATGAHGLLPKAWEGNPSWRDVNGHISTSPPSKESKQQLPFLGASTSITPVERKATVPWTVKPMKAEGMNQGSKLTQAVKGSSVKDAIEL